MPPIGALRPLARADAPAAAALIRAAFAAQAMMTDPPSSALKETAETVAAAITDGGGACIEVAGELAGLVLWSAARGLYFGRLAVLPEYRGNGLARALIESAEAEARRRGLRRVHLSTRLALADNRRLFAACGYRESEWTTHPGYAAPTSVVMEKWLE